MYRDGASLHGSRPIGMNMFLCSLCRCSGITQEIFPNCNTLFMEPAEPNIERKKNTALSKGTARGVQLEHREYPSCQVTS